MPSFEEVVFECRRCEEELPVIETAYGWRAICVGCGIRWTGINGEPEAVGERFSPMADNTRRNNG